MNARLNWSKDEAILKPLFGFQEYIQQSGLELSLLDLVVTRASQLNHCAYCLDMHTKDARASGESEQRLYLLSAWEEAPVFSERERAALAWTEAVTLIAQDFVPDAVYERVRQHFSERELLGLTMAIISINCWNRVNVSFRTPVGNYKSQRQPAALAEAS